MSSDFFPKNKEIERLFFVHPCGWYQAYNDKGEQIGQAWDINDLVPYFKHDHVVCINYRDAHESSESCEQMRREVEDFLEKGIIVPNSDNVWEHNYKQYIVGRKE